MYKLFVVAVLGAGCGAGLEDSSSTQSQALRAGNLVVPCGADQLLICHVIDAARGAGVQLCVPSGAASPQLDPGDFVGACAAVGVPPSVPEPPIPDWTAHQPTPPSQVLAPPPLSPERPQDPRVVETGSSWAPQSPTPPSQLNAESAGATAPEWTPQTPTPPATACEAEGDACGQGFGGCCDGLLCSWGVCVPD